MTHTRFFNRNCSKETNDEEAVRRSVHDCELDFLIIHYFRVLPTDPRFKALTPSQKFQLFCSFKEIPFTLADLQEAAKREGGESVPELTRDDLEGADLSDDEADWYMQEIAKAREAIEGNDGDSQ